MLFIGDVIFAVIVFAKVLLLSVVVPTMVPSVNSIDVVGENIDLGVLWNIWLFFAFIN